MTQYGFFTDTTLCTGCKACLVSCYDHNNLVVPEKIRKVYEFGGGNWNFDEKSNSYTQDAFTYYVSLGCQHCDDPACVAACPVSSMVKDPETGIVHNDPETCIGCMACKTACPYSHPTLSQELNISVKCDMCADTLDDEGMFHPACVEGCPSRALDFGRIEDLRTKYGDVDDIAGFGTTTKPNLVIKAHRDADRGGELLNPAEIADASPVE